MFDITASIVLYKTNNDFFKTIDCFLSSPLNVHLFLIDNSPTNATEKELAKYKNNPAVEYIFNNANVGFGSGHNIAIRKAMGKSKYHVAINPDVYFDATVIEKLFQYAESDEKIGQLLPKILYPEGNIQYVAKLLPSPIDLLLRRFTPQFLYKKRQYTFELQMSSYTCPFEAPYLSGCFMFLRMEALEKVGLFDEQFFMYPEDIDLTRRMHRHYKTICYPLVTVYHEHGKGSYKSLKMLWIHSINMIKYFNKWGWIFDSERRQINEKILKQFG